MLNMGGLDGKFYKASVVISRLAYLNLLWILFTLAGFVVFGIFPSTVALYTIIRKWIMGKDEDLPIFRTYLDYFKKEFMKSNLLGLCLVIAGVAIFVDLAYLPTVNTFLLILRFMIIAVGSVYAVVLLYVFPVYVHYNGNIFAYFKNAAILGLTYPLITFAMFIIGGIIYSILFYFPGLIPFFSVSVFAYIVMRLTLFVFNKVEARIQEKAAEKSGADKKKKNQENNHDLPVHP